VIDVESGEMVRLAMPPDAHRSTTTDHIAGSGGRFLDVQWREDGSQLAFVSSSRDHKVATLRIADTQTGDVRDVLEERVDTYYESGDGENWEVLFDSDEVIWFSERDNWGHLYRYDLNNGQLKRQITQGDWAVHQLLHIDPQARSIYFSAAGREPGDPYFQYFYRVNIDDSKIDLLTPEPANHEVNLSPSHAYFVDAYSTPTTPSITVLRDADGKTILELETADISQLQASGWQPPEPVKVKGRDGVTDIYGLMYKPTDFDPAKSYPILNYLYPGPQSGSVGSRSFRASRSDKQAVAELGFIVVEVDAMGTPGRSKSFHDAYYGNMGDNGIPDQVAAIKELASRHTWMNLDRVGIWGHSGGGFASTRAILQYPDFYKVAVSGAGNHDNRNYEDDWGEKWQGLLESNPDETSNYDNQANQLLAKNLIGKLLIAHGTLDSNVPPSNTMLMVDALVKANKDFDLVMFPNASHGFGSAYYYWTRRRWDYFVRHLKGVEPPKEYELGKRLPDVRIAQPTG
jgi:dipeptidyl aminopeptidase/acylaminoacyl peptidase